MVENKTGMSLRVIDILRQSSSGKNGAKEAIFPWHVDSKNDRLDNRISVIFLLSSTNSSMQMGPEDKPYLEFKYKKQGCGVMFYSKFIHRSCYADEHTEMSLFLTGQKIFLRQVPFTMNEYYDVPDKPSNYIFCEKKKKQ